MKQAGSRAKVATFDLNKDLVEAVRSGDVQFAVDQQPYLQGYLAVDALWLYRTNGNVSGGGEAPVLTGPAFVTKDERRLGREVRGRRNPLTAWRTGRSGAPR